MSFSGKCMDLKRQTLHINSHMQNLDLKKINDRDCFGVVTTKRGKGEKRD
jgi:hypothetical protein